MTSQTIAEFVSDLNALDIQLSVEGDPAAPLNDMRLRCNAPAGELTPELRQKLVDRKAEIISHLSQEKIKIKFPTDCFTATFPLSFAQQRLWFLYQLAPNTPFYNIPVAIRLTGILDQAALERSFQEIVQRHAALRTKFTTLDGQPVQLVEAHINVELAVVDLQKVVTSQRDRLGQQLATAEAQRPFNLTTDPLLRVTLLQFAPTESMLLLTLHHIVADGWSLGVLIRELTTCYTAFVAGRSPSLPALPIQYTDFAVRQRHTLQGEVLENQLAYWREQLQDLPVLQLPSDRSHPLTQTYRGATHPLQISPPVTQALQALSQQSGTSLFMTLLAAFQTLLWRYTGQDDFAIGSPIASRHDSDLEGVIGFFVNSLVLRVDLSGNPTFRELLQRVRDGALAAYDHQDLPFEKLVEELDPDRDPSRNPLFQVAFALQNAPMQPLELPGLKLEPAPLEFGSTRFDLEVHLWEPTHGLRSLWQSQEGLSGFISYSTDLFDCDRISRLIEHFQTLLQGIITNPDAHLADLPLLTATERQQILTQWNHTATQPISHRLFHQIFEAQVQVAPDAIAVVSEQGAMTYAELNEQANGLAQTLQQKGVQLNSLVGLCVDRSADMIVGILGILKAGGAYVPLDPNYPSDRLHFMLTDTQVAIVLTQSWLVEKLPRSLAEILCLDQAELCSDNFPLRQETAANSVGDRLAYVIYTSGSTGTPKGVLLTHRGLCNVTAVQQQMFHLSRSSRILQFSSISFDASIFEIALALGAGGTLYIPPKAAQLPDVALIQFLQDHAITHALLTPAVLTLLPPAELPQLQVLITGGEACSRPVVDRWAGDRHFYNAYGPTETTIWTTIAKLAPGDHPLTIGHPIPNTQVYILDAHLNPTPVGVAGELYIGGVGLAQGYLNRPELTTERFIEIKLPAISGNSNTNSNLKPQALKLYKTGDRVQYGRDGTIEFLGRVDHQIKIRGFRVELGEIEATLKRHPAIQDAVVIAVGDHPDEKRLVVYFSLDRQYLHQSIRQLQTQQIEHWQNLYNQTYQPQNLESKTQNFNITGWNSSYTGAPISPEEMQEWVSDRVQQILALKPKRVLEIGCGTGLLLFQIAPHCQECVGTDFSAIALQSIQSQLDRLNLSHVKLLQRVATDFEGIDPASFDVVILNSIVQYFPSQHYLLEVLEQAIQAVSFRGTIFIGDVRSLPLLTAFHTWMKFNQAESGMTQIQLQQQVERSRFEEPELAIDPMFFHQLRDRFSRIQQVNVRLTRGRSLNEMTQFRYNVLLQIGQSAPHAAITEAPETQVKPFVQTYDWKSNPLTIEAIQKCLCETKPEIVLVRGVTNSRINAAIKISCWLQRKEAPKTVGRMGEKLKTWVEPTIDPQAWWDLETVLPYTVEITWAMPLDTGDYDVLLTRQDVDATIDLLTPQLINPSAFHYTNEPLQSNFARQLIPELRQHLQQTLPNYMIPSAFVPLAALPLTTNGKVDHIALPLLDAEFTQTQNETNSSSSTTETTLTEIWQELLRLKQINRHDNFFELGGHSLLATQMTSRVRDIFGLELPLKNVFEAPTIAQLASILETLRDTAATPQIPPLVRLDRSAYRRQRSTLPGNKPEISSTQSALHPQGSADQLEPSVLMSRSPLVPLALGGSSPPFFCVHPMFGVVFPYLELAHHLGRRNFYGLQPLGLDGKTPPLNRIEAIAAYYIKAIQAIQPHGPYYLGGWSFGGLVAFEMAQQLTQAGQQIDLLAILDTPAPCHRLSFVQSLKFLLNTAFWSTLPFLLDYSTLIADRCPFWHGWFARKLSFPSLSRTAFQAIARLIPEESRLQLLDETAIHALLPIVYANSQAVYRYVPQPYSGTLTLFRAIEQPEALKHESTLNWSTLVSD